MSTFPLWRILGQPASTGNNTDFDLDTQQRDRLQWCLIVTSYQVFTMKKGGYNPINIWLWINNTY